MSRSMNRIQLLGHTGRDPEIRTTQTGTKVANLSLATSRRFQQNGEWQKRTEWHRLTLWGRLAELAEDYVHKGDRLYAEGQMTYGSYEREGVTIPTAEVHVRELILLGSASRSAHREAEAPSVDEEDDLPF